MKSDLPERTARIPVRDCKVTLKASGVSREKGGNVDKNHR